MERIDGVEFFAVGVLFAVTAQVERELEGERRPNCQEGYYPRELVPCKNGTRRR